MTSLIQLAAKTLRHHWRTNLAVVLGIAVGTAVLAGALIVGDSVRDSLRRLTIERLGRIDEVLLAEHFFRPALADSFRESAEVVKYYEEIVPAVLVANATVETPAGSRQARVNGVTLVGSDASFWSLDTSGNRPTSLPGADEIVINRPLAEELGVKLGDELIVRLGKQGGVALDSPLARKTDRTRTIAGLKVVDIVAAEGLGRFSLQASQSLPANAFLSRDVLARALDQDDKVNALLVAGKSPDEPAPDQGSAALKQALRPTLTDLGLALKHVTLSFETEGKSQEVLAYESLSTDRMLFSPEADAAVSRALDGLGAQPAFTYLATRIEKLDAASGGDKTVVPYSTVTAIDSTAALGPVLDEAGRPVGPLGDDGIVLNSWTADVLSAKVGDRVKLTFFEPETTHGQTIERTESFIVRDVVEIVTPVRPFRRRRPAEYDQPPTLANDPDLTPEVPGITDQESIASWDAPFEIDHTLLTRRDDLYWENYRTTPKAFVSLEAGRRLWDSRFGHTTSYRIPSTESHEQLATGLADKLRENADAFGLTWLRVKQDGLQASKGTTPFEALFLGFSSFLIAAALMLVSLLFRLGIEQRADQIGLLKALGFTRRRVSRVLLFEGALVALVGSLLGILIGVGYAWLMLAGLRTWWLAAVVTPFMHLSVRPTTLALGAGLGVMFSLATIAWTLRGLGRVPVRQLLAGRTEETSQGFRRTRGWSPIIAIGLFVVSLVLGVLGTRLAGEQQAGAFFGSGACVLAAALVAVAGKLRSSSVSQAEGSVNLDLPRLAGRNMTRNPGRSTLTIGLVAAACFLIVAISAFRLAPTSAGTGGFQLVGQSDQPIVADLNDADQRVDLLGVAAAKLEGVSTVAMRMQEGDDASCRNLYQVSRPRILGVTPDLIEHFDDPASTQMQWAGSAATGPAGPSNPWRLLSSQGRQASEPVPVVLDKNTAMYSLHLYQGIGEEFELDYGEYGRIRFRVVGLLANSILQGSLLVSERDLIGLFPRVGGYRFFLVSCPPARSAEVASTLEEALSDQGLDLTGTKRLLTDLLAVQNTYLSTFQSLGGLGLLLGTFGLAAIQIRNVLQRRGELALLRATGFRRRRLSRLILWEHALLLFAGLAVGVVSALVAVLPHMFLGAASVPFGTLIGTLGLVAAVGLVTGMIAVYYASKTPLLPALRGD